MQMQTTTLLAETTCYPFAVMVMAASMASATPVALLLDTVASVSAQLGQQVFPPQFRPMGEQEPILGCGHC